MTSMPTAMPRPTRGRPYMPRMSASPAAGAAERRVVCACRRQRGMAVISALLIVTAVALLITGLFQRQAGPGGLGGVPESTGG